MDKREKKNRMITLALGIALLPPLWAVLSPFLGISTGAVALICAGLYVANGNQIKDAFKICVGFLLGDVWAMLAVWFMENAQIQPQVELYLTLCVLGGLAVLIGETLHQFIYTPSWLCGWAIGLTILGPLSVAEFHTLPIEIGVAMVVGVVYVGIGVDAFQKFLLKRMK